MVCSGKVLVYLCKLTGKAVRDGGCVCQLNRQLCFHYRKWLTSSRKGFGPIYIVGPFCVGDSDDKGCHLT